MQEKAVNEWPASSFQKTKALFPRGESRDEGRIPGAIQRIQAVLLIASLGRCWVDFNTTKVGSTGNQLDTAGLDAAVVANNPERMRELPHHVRTLWGEANNSCLELHRFCIYCVVSFWAMHSAYILRIHLNSWDLIG